MKKMNFQNGSARARLMGGQWVPMIVLRLGPKLFSFIANLHNCWSKQVSAASVLSRVVAQLLLQLGRCFILKIMSRTIVVTQRTTLLPPGINSRQVMLVRQVVSRAAESRPSLVVRARSSLVLN